MPKIDKAALGARVLKRRTVIGVSQTTLALAVGMKQQGIANIEQGLVEKPRNLLELARALQTTPEWLLYEQGLEEVRPRNAREQLAEVVYGLRDNRLGAAFEYLKRLAEDEAEAAS